MQQESIQAQRYPESRACLQKDCNFIIPPTGSNSYTLLSWMSCSSGSFASHLCDSMTQPKYMVTASVMGCISMCACLIDKDKSALYSVLSMNSFICA